MFGFLARLFSLNNSEAYWSIVIYDGKLHHNDQRGKAPADRKPISKERLKELAKPDARILIEEINSYYFPTSSARKQFFKTIDGKVPVPKLLQKKESQAKPAFASNETEFEIGPASSKKSLPVSYPQQQNNDASTTLGPGSGAALVTTVEQMLQNEDAGKTLGPGQIDTDIDISKLEYVYMWKIIDNHWERKLFKPNEIPQGSRPEVDSDLKRAESGDLRSKELQTIYFSKQKYADRVMSAYKASKSRSTKPA